MGLLLLKIPGRFRAAEAKDIVAADLVTERIARRPPITRNAYIEVDFVGHIRSIWKLCILGEIVAYPPYLTDYRGYARSVQIIDLAIRSPGLRIVILELRL